MNRKELENRLIRYAVTMLKISGKIDTNGAGKVLANQLYRSGISPALNYAEAQGAESKRDFIHKIKISLKELRESHVTLRIISKSGLMHKESMEEAIQESNELVSIFVKITKTADANLASERSRK